MKLQTITTIELSSICNLRCGYCINRLMSKNGRRPTIMQDDIFYRSIKWLKALCDLETQKEVNLNGNGESTLDPNLAIRVRQVKDVMKDRKVQFCTNGVAMTEELAIELKNAGIDRIDLSVHDAYHARRCAHLLTRVGIPGTVNFGTIISSHNWAGQLEKEHQIDMRIALPCHPLIEGRGYIDSDGFVTPCCYDYLRLGAFGHVNDRDLLDKDIKRFSLCETCHQVIPPGVGI